jgi:glycosyltransferase involved in cell wall biosynthesis
MIVKTMENILILTPVKDASGHLDTYFRLLDALTYDHARISLGFLESDSTDDTYHELEKRLPGLRSGFRSAGLWKKDFHFSLPEGKPRWALGIQQERRAVLARSRNHLLFRALEDEDWVLWLDSDLIDYPPDIIQRLLSTGKYIVHPNTVVRYGGNSFDRNAWRDKGRLHLHDLKHEGDLVRLDTVGGTMLFIKADLHREGLVFPPFYFGNQNPLIRTRNRITSLRDAVNSLDPGILAGKPVSGEIETEGLGIMAHEMGYECWGMPNLEILHKNS